MPHDTNETVPTQFVEFGGVRSAYRRVKRAAAWIAVQARRVTLHSPTTVAKIRRANVGHNEQDFVDAFNTQMLPVTQSG